MKKTNTRPFTLLELIIVIAIIGILMTLLLPSLENARKASKQALSMSNLKQMHVGTMSYASKNDGWLFDHSTNWHPTAGINSETGQRNSSIDWERMLYESMIDQVLTRDEAAQHMANDTAYYNTFFCPLLREIRPTRIFTSAHGDGDYSMNRFFLTHRNIIRLVGEKEPIFVGGAQNPSRPSVANDDFRNGTYDPNGSQRPAYDYLNG